MFSISIFSRRLKRGHEILKACRNEIKQRRHSCLSSFTVSSVRKEKNLNRWFSKLNGVGSGIEWNTGYRVGFGYPQGTVLRTFFSKLLRTDSTFYDKFFSKKYLVWSFVRPSFSNGFRCLSVSILKSGRGGPPREYFILKWQRIALYGNGAVSAHDNQS